MTTPLVIVILAVMWTVVLVPPLLRSRSEGRPSASVGDFRRQLSTLQRTMPHSMSRMAGRPAGPYRPLRPAAGSRSVALAARPTLAVAGPRFEVRRRRQNILFALAGSAVLTAVLAGGMYSRTLWLLHIALDVLLVSYIVLLVQSRRADEVRTMRDQWFRAA